MDTQVKKKNSNIVFALVIVISVCFGYMLGYFGKCENNIASEVYQLPDNIVVTGVSFKLEKGILTCEFVPELYSDKLTYNVTVIDIDGNGRKSDVAMFEDGVGEVNLPVEHSQYYKIVLEITNGEESRNVTLGDKLYVNNKNNTVTLH